MEQPATYYDLAYKTRPEYTCHYSESYYYPMWEKVIDMLKTMKELDILELGCGTGQFAHMLEDRLTKKYRGIDFSKEAISIAFKKCKQRFWIEDFKRIDKKDFAEYTCIMALEVLEHINNDIQIIDKIKTGTHFIFSVPSFDDPAHVRYFRNENEVRNRYEDKIDIQRIDFIKRIFLCFGIKK